MAQITTRDLVKNTVSVCLQRRLVICIHKLNQGICTHISKCNVDSVDSEMLVPFHLTIYTFLKTDITRKHSENRTETMSLLQVSKWTYERQQRQLLQKGGITPCGNPCWDYTILFSKTTHTIQALVLSHLKTITILPQLYFNGFRILHLRTW